MSPAAAAPYVLLVVVYTLLGRVAARRLRLPTAGLEGFAFAYGLGTGLGSLLLFALVSLRALGLPSGTAGLAGGPGTVGPGPWDAILWLGFLVAGAEAVRLARARAHRPAGAATPTSPLPPRPPLPPRRRPALETVPLVFALVLGLAALAPEIGGDALAAHLPAAARFVRDGVRPMEGLLDGEGRLGFAILAVPRLLGAWPAGPALLHAAAGLGLVAAVHAETARRAGRRTATLLAALLLATPAIAGPAATFGADLGLGLHAVLALLCAARAVRGEPGAPVVAAGLCAGFAANDHLSGLLVALATGLSIHVGLGARRGTRPSVLAGGLALAVATPWILRAWRDTGNPLFPFAVERLGAGWADPTLVDAATLAPFRTGAALGVVGRVGAPVGDAFARGAGAALPLALLVVAAVAALVAPPRGRGEGLALVVGGTLLGLLGLAGFPLARFLVPVLALTAIAAATGLHRLASRDGGARVVARCLLGVLLVAGAWDVTVSARAVAPRLAALRSPEAAEAFVDAAHPGIRAGAAFAATVPGPVLFASEATAAVGADAVSTTPTRNGVLPAGRIALPSNAYLREELRRRRWPSFVFRPARPEDAPLAAKAVDLLRKRLGTLRASADGVWQAFVLTERR